MSRVQAAFGLMLVLVCLGVWGCIDTRSCTEIGCGTGLNIQVAPSSGSWPDGMYSIQIALDDTQGSCEVRFPEDLPARGAVTTLPCGEGIQAMIEQRARCVETRSGDAVNQSCTPIVGQYDVIFWLYQEPKHLTLQLQREGDPLLNHDADLQYTENRPNGPECEPVCRQASVELTF